MIEIIDGFTSISAGSDEIAWPDRNALDPTRASCGGHSSTGARVTVEFERRASLPADQPVRVRYDFAGDGRLREGRGTPVPTRTVVRWGHDVIHHYRVTYWIAPAAIMNFVARNVRNRTEEGEISALHSLQQTSVVG